MQIQKYFGLIQKKSAQWGPKQVLDKNLLSIIKILQKNAEEAQFLLDHQGYWIHSNSNFAHLVGPPLGKKKPISNIKTKKQGASLDELIQHKLFGKKIWVGKIEITQSKGPKQTKVLRIIHLKYKKTHFYYGIIYQNHHPLTDKITQEKEAYLKHLLSYDGLTGLPNKILFKETCRKWALESTKTKKYGLLILLKAHTLRDLNESLERQAKNQLVIQIAHRLKSSLKTKHYLARISETQFGILLKNLSEKKESQAQVHSLVHIIESAGFILKLQTQKETKITLHFNIGLSLFPKDGIDEDILLQKAFSALNEPKLKKYQFYTQKLSQKKKNSFKLIQELKQSIKNKEFILHYQPRYHLKKKTHRLPRKPRPLEPSQKRLATPRLLHPPC